MDPDVDALRASAREFAEREVAPRAAQRDEEEFLEPELIRKLAELGYLGIPIPAQYGGLGLGFAAYLAIVEEIGRADSSVRSLISVHTSLVGLSILAWGSDSLKERWLPKMTSGEVLSCFGLTEPQSGSDAEALLTRAETNGDGWVIFGSKIFISLGTTADVCLLFARTAQSGSDGITAFLVPLDAAGVGATRMKGKLGLKGADIAELTFEGVKIPSDSVVGEVGSGFKIAMSALDNGRLSVAAGCVGISQACLDASVRYSIERHQFGRPIARFQLVQELLADMAVRTEAARLLVWNGARLKDEGKRVTKEAAIAKLHASEAAFESATAAIQVHGGYGYLNDFPVERYLRDAASGVAV